MNVLEKLDRIDNFISYNNYKIKDNVKGIIMFVKEYSRSNIDYYLFSNEKEMLEVNNCNCINDIYNKYENNIEIYYISGKRLKFKELHSKNTI